MKLSSSFFKKTNEQNRSIHSEDVVDIPVYGPHDNILPVPYEASDFFAGFETGFESMCRDFLNKTTLDKYNKGYMDSLIDQMVEEALGLLDVQEIGHRNVINQLARTRSSDINDADIRLSQIPKERESVDSDVKLLEEIYHRGTVLESGKGFGGDY